MCVYILVFSVCACTSVSIASWLSPLAITSLGLPAGSGQFGALGISWTCPLPTDQSRTDTTMLGQHAEESSSHHRLLNQQSEDDLGEYNWRHVYGTQFYNGTYFQTEKMFLPSVCMQNSDYQFSNHSGFDPWDVSKQGLADLLETEAGMKHTATSPLSNGLTTPLDSIQSPSVEDEFRSLFPNVNISFGRCTHTTCTKSTTAHTFMYAGSIVHIQTSTHIHVCRLYYTHSNSTHIHVCRLYCTHSNKHTHSCMQALLYTFKQHTHSCMQALLYTFKQHTHSCMQALLYTFKQHAHTHTHSDASHSSKQKQDKPVPSILHSAVDSATTSSNPRSYIPTQLASALNYSYHPVMGGALAATQSHFTQSSSETFLGQHNPGFPASSIKVNRTVVPTSQTSQTSSSASNWPDLGVTVGNKTSSTLMSAIPGSQSAGVRGQNVSWTDPSKG